MKRIIAALILITLALLAWQVAAAGIPATISYQGTLTDKTGAPVGTVAVPVSKKLTFSIYSTTSGAGPVWSEQQDVTVTNGLFSTVFGGNSLTNPLNLDGFPGKGWLGIRVGSDATEMRPLQQLTSVPYAINSYNGVPPGAIMAYGGVTPPPGWLLCDGRSMKRTDYPLLFNAIGTAHGSADATHFNIPDYRGRFLRGVDYSPNVTPAETGNDPDRNDTTNRTIAKPGGNSGNAVGSIQPPAFLGHNHGGGVHNHTMSISPCTHGDWVYTGIALSGNGTYDGSCGDDNTHVRNSASIIGKDGGNETRPVNAYVNWIIKY